jgi:hypothetical protein
MLLAGPGSLKPKCPMEKQLGVTRSQRSVDVPAIPV